MATVSSVYGWVGWIWGNYRVEPEITIQSLNQSQVSPAFTPANQTHAYCDYGTDNTSTDQSEVKNTGSVWGTQSIASDDNNH